MQVVYFTIALVLFIVVVLTIALSFKNGIKYIRVKKSFSNGLLYKSRQVKASKNLSYEYTGQSYNPKEEEDSVK